MKETGACQYLKMKCRQQNVKYIHHHLWPSECGSWLPSLFSVPLISSLVCFLSSFLSSHLTLDFLLYSHLQFHLWKIGDTPSLFEILSLKKLSMKIAVMIFGSINQPFYKRLKFTDKSWPATTGNDWGFTRLISQKIYNRSPAKNPRPPVSPRAASTWGGPRGIFI